MAGTVLPGGEAPAARLSEPGLAEPSLVETLATALVGAVLLLILVGLDPLPDLSNDAVLAVTFSGDALANALFVGLTGLALACVALRDARGLRAQLRAPLLLLLAWLPLTVLVSPDASASARRLALALIVWMLAAMLPLLAGSLRRLAILLALGAAAALVISWAGVLLVPERAIHGPGDVGVTDVGLFGAWRGLYGHKNAAGPMMAIFVFVGLFAARAWNARAGLAIALAAGLFLPFTMAKSAIGLAFVALAAGAVLPRLRSVGARAILVFGPVLALNLLSVGTVMSPALASLAATLPLDTSFTGRTDIWALALENIARRPLLGHGFQAFWRSEAVLFGSEDLFSWAETASTSHNSSLELALSTGLPGLALAVGALVLLPFRDLNRQPPTDAAAAAFRLLCTRIWLFGLYLASFEAFLLNRSDPIWFMFAFAVCGLRYASAFRLRAA